MPRVTFDFLSHSYPFISVIPVICGMYMAYVHVINDPLLLQSSITIHWTCCHYSQHHPLQLHAPKTLAENRWNYAVLFRDTVINWTELIGCIALFVDMPCIMHCNVSTKNSK